jgi:hypothetical protein
MRPARWPGRALDYQRPGVAVGGFATARPGTEGECVWTPEPGFLDGAAGIGLVLLAAATPVAPAWDRILLLS